MARERFENIASSVQTGVSKVRNKDTRMKFAYKAALVATGIVTLPGAGYVTGYIDRANVSADALNAFQNGPEPITEVMPESVNPFENSEPQKDIEKVEQHVLSPVFTKEVKYWESKISEWSDKYGLDPNLAAIIMQVESCGDPLAVSSAGAQGLFQVMPFHFDSGENPFDPDTNARRGLNYFTERLIQTNGDIGFAFAGYNGGHVAAGSSWDNWAAETQQYYVWTTGILQDIDAGQSHSETLQRWLQAGGASLCSQASARLGLQQ